MFYLQQNTKIAGLQASLIRKAYLNKNECGETLQQLCGSSHCFDGRSVRSRYSAVPFTAVSNSRGQASADTSEGASPRAK